MLKFIKSSLPASLLLALLTSLSFSSCKKDIVRAKALPEAVKSYVYAYTSGVISKSSPVRIRFAGAAVSEDKIGTEDGDVLDFAPSANGTAIWEDDHTLRFEPKKGWKPGQAYVATVALDEVFDNLPKEARSFEFDFLIREQGLSVEVHGLEYPDPGDLTREALKGLVFTNDRMETEKLEQVVTVKQNGKAIPVSWEHDENGNNHYFTAAGIVRGNQPSDVEIFWNASPVDMKIKGSKTMTVPELGNFSVVSARVVEGESQYIVLYFSDPLLPQQDLSGLIGLQGYRKRTDSYYAAREGDYFYNESTYESIRLTYAIDGNKLLIYPNRRLTGTRKFELRPGIRNFQNVPMAKPGVWQVGFEQIKPKVRMVSRGVILPSSDEGLVLPFEAVSLEAVEVEIFKIYDNNILQFLQTSNMDGTNNYELKRVGKVVKREMVPLKGLKSDANFGAWTRYALDLSKLFDAGPNALYQVRIGFRPEYALYQCTNRATQEGNLKTVSQQSYLDNNGEIRSFWGDYYGIDGYYPGWNYRHRYNPCYPAYYNSEHFAQSNVFASDLGITAKAGSDGSIFVAVADLRTTKGVGDAELEFYDYQQQLLGTAKTNGSGVAELTLDKPPFVIIAKKENQKGYLKTADGNALSLSRFDVAGTVAQKGLKGFLYGERGVWRPGDSLHLNFILEDKSGKLPKNYPIAFELKDSRGQLQYQTVTTKNVENVYPLPVATSPDAPTGNWTAIVKAGGATFHKTLKIETVKPNRLKINLDFGTQAEELSYRDEPVRFNMQVGWLHGAPAQNLRTVVEMNMRQMNTVFPGFKEYEFDDPARHLYSEPVTIFDGITNQDGYVSFSSELYRSKVAAPGKLNIGFRARAFEQGGDFSTYNFKKNYNPYPAYAGINIPKTKYGVKQLDINTENSIKMAVVDADGKPLKNRSLSIGLYRVEWRWWWDQGRDYVSKFNSSNHFNALLSDKIKTGADGTVSWPVTVNDWGRYLVRVCDEKGGHCTGDFFNAGYPWYDEEGGASSKKEAAMMTFTAGKEKYKVGENIEITVPAGDEGRVLITLETGSKVLKSMWKDAEKGDNTYKFKATGEMSPTVYAHVSLIQPHAQVQNDLPIRMYGVLAVDVENPETILKPVITMGDELKPEQEFTVEVKEANNEEMAYTIAIVDEGLLGLTNFKTPDPHTAFYAREALGVKTWDVYDDVLGAYGGELERILSIGGDAEINAPPARKNANRFKPVVLFAGPFHLDGGKKKHTFKMPNYVGSVRVMVVAANRNAAYGSVEKVVPVRKPLMVLATLPRVLGPGEKLRMPVSVFAMDRRVSNVEVGVAESSGLVKLGTPVTKRLDFPRPGEDLLYFDLTVGDAVGIAKFKITARGGGETSTQEIELDVRNPNPYVTNVFAGVIQPGESWSQAYDPVGSIGTNSGILEVSAIPPINLGKRLDFLIKYPHGCIEQTTSAVFPQLFVNKLMQLNDGQKKRVQRNIEAGIGKLKNFQTGSGGFSYWPGSDYDAWGTNYAGHFLLEAKKAGYAVSKSMLDRFVKYQKRAAKQWDPGTRGTQRSFTELDQAYRLYTLALAREPELSAMNRMRELPNLTNEARWRLAAAYALAGKKEIGQGMVKNATTEVQPYAELGYSYGSDLRDEAMILETQVLLEDQNNAAINARTIAQHLSEDKWYSTQTTAYALLALGKFLGNSAAAQEFTFTYDVDGKVVNAGSSTPIMQVEVPVEKSNTRQVNVKNTTDNVLYARLILTGQPLAGDEVAAARNSLLIQVMYLTTQGAPLDPSNLPQGTDFIAQVMVTHPGTRASDFKEMALSQIFPSGWEIINARLHNFQEFSNTTIPEYVDIRDDRVYTYFDIRKNTRQIYRVRLNAAYQGRYFMPAVNCEAMYDNTINARQPGQWVNVVQVGNL
ncbi:MAG: alpha-2-macroglobulin [Saprospiraceae bacterium]